MIYGLVVGLAAFLPKLSAADHDDDDDHDRDRNGPAVHPPNGERVRPQKVDRELRNLMREVDDRRIEATIKKLVSFGTRHTESSMTDPNRGIGAALNYVFTQMQGFAAASNGRMTVERQTYHQPFVAGSILTPDGVDITNIVATIRGSTTPNRVYVITGHIDSRRTIVTDAAGDAPGADDDASGTAVVMEVARVLAKHAPESTIVLGIVDGEEQGLFGSRNMARSFAGASALPTPFPGVRADIQGDFSNDIVGSSRSDDGTRDAHRLR